MVDLRGSGTYADNVEFLVGDGARLGVISIADWADDAVHVSAHHARLGKDAVLRHVTVTLGGDVVRTARRCGSTGPAATPNCSAPTSPTTASSSSTRLLVDHAQPNCRSDVLYKGALQGDPDSARTPSGSATC